MELLESRQMLSAGVFAFGVDENGGPASMTASYVEDAGVVRIPVHRVGGSDGPVSVEYGCVGGPKTPGNFTHVSGRLSFADGQDVAYIDLPLHDDALSQDTTRLVFELRQPQGGALIPAAPTTATVYILDNEPVAPMIVVGPDAGKPKPVQVFDTSGNLKYSFYPYGEDWRWGVRVATADLNGDSVPDIVTAAGQARKQFTAMPVKVFDGATGGQLDIPIGSFLPYGPEYRGGVFVAAGDLNGDGVPDVITGTDRGFGPMVKAFSGADGSELTSFFAFEPSAKTGVRVAFGRGVIQEAGGAVTPAIVAASGPGAGQLSVFATIQPIEQALPQRVGNFHPFGTRATVGMFVSASSTTGEMTITTTPASKSGRGASRYVQTYSVNGQQTGSLIPYGPRFKGQTRLEMADYDGDGVPDVVMAPSAGTPARVRIVSGSTQTPMLDFMPYGPKHRSGIFVAIDRDDACVVAQGYRA